MPTNPSRILERDWNRYPKLESPILGPFIRLQKSSDAIRSILVGCLLIAGGLGNASCTETPTLKPQIVLELTSGVTTPVATGVWIYRDGADEPTFHDVAIHGNPSEGGFFRTWLLGKEGAFKERVVFKAVSQTGQVVALGNSEIDFRAPSVVRETLRILDGTCDEDSDGYVAASCLRSFEQALISFDHEPNDPNAYPGAEEVCDLVDNDGNSQVDEVGCDTLNDLAFGPVSLTPAFAPHITEYTAEVTLLESQIKLTANASHPEAILEIAGTQMQSGETLILNLQPGETAVPITVKSISGSIRTYTITITMDAESNSLMPQNPIENELFGASMAIAQGRLLVGAPGNATCETREATQACFNTGAVYVFQPFNGSFNATWNNEPTILKAKTTDPDIGFGTSIAADGATVVIGAPGEEPAGAAYIFQYSSGHWLLQAHLTPPATEKARIGSSVAISGNTVVVGASDEGSCAVGVNGTSAEQCPKAGAAYVFERNNGAWPLKAYLKAHNTDADDIFGGAVSIRGNLIVVGAIGESSCGTADWSSNLCPDSGATYLFQRLDGIWSYKETIKATTANTGDLFGASLALGANELMVGARSEGGCDPDKVTEDPSCQDSGALFVFEKADGIWTQTQRLKTPVPAVDEYFGTSISLEGSQLLVGAIYDRGCISGVNPDTSSETLECPGAGAAYLFKRTEEGWEHFMKLKSEAPQTDGYFGASSLIDNDRLFLGAIYETETSCEGSCDGHGRIYIYE